MLVLSSSMTLKSLIPPLALLAVFWVHEDKLGGSMTNTAEPGQELTPWKTQPKRPKRNVKAYQPSAAEMGIIARIKRFFEVSNETERREITRQIEVDRLLIPAKSAIGYTTQDYMASLNQESRQLLFVSKMVRREKSP